MSQKIKPRYVDEMILNLLNQDFYYYSDMTKIVICNPLAVLVGDALIYCKQERLTE